MDEVGQDEDDEGEDDEADATMKAFMMMFMGKCLTTRHAAGGTPRVVKIDRTMHCIDTRCS